MAQIVKLKRTAVSGRIPTTSNLELGELAMNTYDGRIFFEKSGSSESIQEILTTNSHPYAITGSLYLKGAITASYFKGDGSQLTNLPSTVGIEEATTVTASFAGVDDITVTHNFDTYNVLVQVFDSNRSLIIPATTTLPTVNTARVTLSSTGAGYVVVAKAGHLISGSLTSEDSSLLNGQNGAYYLNWNNFNNIPSGIISSSAQIDTLFDIDGLVSSSAQISGYNTFLEINGDGVISGSSQITDLTTHKETVSGASSYAVTHNLNESYPIVQAWNTSTSQQELPQTITTNSANQVTVVFSTTFAGVIIVKK